MHPVLDLRAAPRPRVCYEFGPFILDPAERLLRRGGAPLHVLPKVLDALTVLVEHAGHLVTKEELMVAVWPGLVVEENTLTVAVCRLRALLKDAGRHGRYIETVTGYGYRFVAPIEVVGPGPDVGSSRAFSRRPARPLGPSA